MKLELQTFLIVDIEIFKLPQLWQLQHVSIILPPFTIIPLKQLLHFDLH